MAADASLPVFFVSIDLEVDALWDLADPVTFHRMAEAVEEGLIDIILGGPPCATWSRARYLPTPGPRPVRRRGEFAWGLPDLTASESARVNETNVLTMNTLCLMESCSSRGGGHLLEHPADPGLDPLPSIFATPEVLEWEQRTSSTRVSFHQCMLGGPTVKPTMISSTLDLIETFNGLWCDGSHDHERAIGVAEGVHLTRRLASYPSEMCKLIAECIMATLLRFAVSGAGPTGWRRSSAPAPRITAWSNKCTPTCRCATAVLNEASARGKGVVVDRGQTALYVHVDDGVVLAAGGTGLANAVMNGCGDALEDIGFEVSNRQPFPELHKIVGYEPERRPARLRLPAERGALLQQALRHQTTLVLVDTRVLRSLTGVWVWAALLRRDVLTIPYVFFKFLDFADGAVVPWWRSARREVSSMATAVAALYADLGAPLAPVLFATDAMGANDDDGGFGIVGRDISEQLARTVFEVGRRPGYSVTKLSGVFTGLRRPEEQIQRRVPLSLLPRELLRPTDELWKPIEAGRWRFADHIALGERRAVVRLARRLSCVPAAHRLKFVSLQDNGAAAGAFAKGRSPAPAVNFLLRQRTASSLAAELTAILPWVQTAAMAADGLSRLL